MRTVLPFLLLDRWYSPSFQIFQGKSVIETILKLFSFRIVEDNILNKDRWFFLAVVANLLSLAVCALYAGRGPLTMVLMPCLHILL